MANGKRIRDAHGKTVATAQLTGGEILGRQHYRTNIFSGRRGAVLAIVVLALLALLAARLDPAPPPVGGHARASDGDSFRLGDERVRLLGLDAPELAQQCDAADGKQWPCGRVARDRMAALLSAGRVDCRPEDKDQYDRLLAYCTAGGLDLGAVMVSEGLAIASGAYWQQEAEARGAGRGIWAGGFDRPRSWRDDHPRPQGAWGFLSGFDF